MHKGGIVIGLIALSIIACSSSDSDSADVRLGDDIGTQNNDNNNRGPTLVDLKDEPAGGRCPAGGTAIRTGRDRNFDGRLQNDEVEEVKVVCNGSAGKTPVLKSKPEAIGTRCPTGGQAISWGLRR